MYLKHLTDRELVRYAQGVYLPSDQEALVQELAARLLLYFGEGYAQPDPDPHFGQPHYGHEDEEDDD